jgi:hypothetical protein
VDTGAADPAGLFNDDVDEAECVAVPDFLASKDEITNIRQIVEPTAAYPETP